MNDVKPAAPYPAVYCVGTHRKTEQLRPRNVAVLAARELRNRPILIASATFAVHIAVNVDLAKHGADLPPPK
jgi:hypothetical protein